MPIWYNWYFQDILSNNFQLDLLHSKILSVQIIISLMVGMVILSALFQKFTIKVNEEWMVLEILWTVLPGFVLIWLGIPSLTLLYESESLTSLPDVILKVTGHQWYWSFNLPEMNVDFDSITIKDGDVFPLMEVSEKMVLPMNKIILFLVTSDDVIHSFAVPELAVKADANPGRLNSINSFCRIPGQLMGQCSELCGSLHSNMTIFIEISSFKLFIDYIASLNES